MSQNPDSLSITEHLDELRSRIILSLYAFLAGSFLSAFFPDLLFHIIKKPAGNLQLIYISPAEGFMIQLKLYFIAGFIVSSPVILFHILRFIMPAFTEKESRAFIFFFPLSVFLFVLGTCFSYFLMLPACIGFLSSFTQPGITAMFTLNNYTSFFMQIILVSALFFELPLVLLFLAKIGTIHTAFLRKNRKYAFLVSLILSAFLTPPDIISQIFLAVPIMILYELSILLISIFISKPE